MRIKAHAVGIAAEDYFNDKVLEDTDLLYTGDACSCRRTSGTRHGKDMESWQEHGRTLYRIRGPLVPAMMVNMFVYHEGDKPFLAMVKEIARQDRGAADAQGLLAPQEQRVGHHRAQPRAELRAQPADGPGDRLRHAARPGRHRQDAAHARRGPHADARLQGLQRDHHDARHRPGGRGHRLPARHRGGEDDAVDGRARGQPRRADAHRRRGRRLGPRRDGATSSATASR